LGTVYLRADRKNNIDALLNQPEANYVAFVPDPIGTNTSVTYSIWVVKDDPSKVYPKTVGTLGDTNFDANPSPPKGYAQ
jgi:hypothetical protein